MARKAPQDVLVADVAKLRRVGQNLFTTNEPEFITRDKGLYASLIVQPSKRLANVLSLDREILALFSPFTDQQQRTVKTARDLISASDGRLESTVALIVHKDPEGNAKLSKWGRTLGIAILPVFSGKMPNTPEELERHLCHELFSHDPFDVTGPVSDDDNFFGRRNEALDLARKLQTGQIRSCLGIRKIGKTSVINRVINDARQHYDCYSVMLDCSKDEIWSRTADQLMTALAEAIEVAISSTARYAAVSGPSRIANLAEATQRLLAAVKGSTRPIILFIDEVDYITPGSPTCAHWSDEFNPFWRNFRAVYQEAIRDKKALSVMVGGVSSKWFSIGVIGGVENAALALIPEEYLSPLARVATVAMIKKIARSAGLVFSESAADLISAACSDMPFWVRKACSFIHRHIEIESRPTTISANQAKSFVASFVKEEGATLAGVALSHLFRVYPELEGPSIASVDAKVVGLNPAHVTVLRKYGVFANSDPVDPSGSMMRAALLAAKEQRDALQTSFESTQNVLPVIDRSALDEWADDLAVINKGRNILEKKLRQLVLNFIRLDSVTNKKRGQTRDRLLAPVSPERNKRLSLRPADELVEELLWTELVAVIQMEWSVFSGVFSDRKQFEQHANVINDRFDAHAKTFDVADLALYRRSLKWMTERIASM